MCGRNFGSLLIPLVTVGALTDSGVERPQPVTTAQAYCPQCRAVVSPAYTWCPQCGYGLKTRECAYCGNPVGVGERFCPSCGAPNSN